MPNRRLSANAPINPTALATAPGQKLSAPAISPSPFWEVALGRTSHPHLIFQANQVFVIMAIRPETKKVYKAIKDECKKQNFDATRVDDVHGSGVIISEIVDLITKAEFIVCDLTDARPNVYYELGYAHGVGNHGSNILLIAKEGTELHFDVKPMRVAFYKSTRDLRSKVKSFAQAVIERRPKILGAALKPADLKS